MFIEGDLASMVDVCQIVWVTSRRTALDDALSLALGQMRHVWHRRLRALDLTPPQGITLKMLADAPAPMRLIADALSCDASNMTGIADRLEERGLVERRVDAADRRVKLLSLTVAGRELIARIDAPIADELPGVARLSGPERAQLADLLQRAFG
jgi:DNA-binding MarR family transcriptional regulator